MRRGHELVSLDPLGRPSRSRVRFQVLAFTVLLAGLSYLDRVCISLTAPEMMNDLHLTKGQMSYVFSAFTLAYALFEVPTGAWGDRIGTRRVLTRIVVWWSSFTIATAAAFDYVSLLVIRFLFGAGEAGGFPNVTRTFARWFPRAERGQAQGIFFAGAHLGGGLAQMMVAALLVYLPWRVLFVLFGSVGFIWAWAWYRWFRDEPAEHPAVNEAERTYIAAGQVAEAGHRLDRAAFERLASSRSLIALCLMYFTQAYGFYFNITWLPTYLKENRGFEKFWLGVFSGLPLVLSALADVLGGLTTDGVTRRWGLRAGRCGVGAAALVVAGAALIAGALAENRVVSAVLIAGAGAGASFLLGSCWGVCIDIGGSHSGMVSGCMNTSGQIGAVLGPVVLPMFLKGDRADWETPLILAGGLYLAGAVCWAFVDPRKPLFGAGAESVAPAPDTRRA
jgi:ACS family glucarate transporter-like MFS transporter